MAPRLAEAWSNRAHGTSTSTNSMISAQLLILEAGISTAEACQIKATLVIADLKIEMATLRRMLEVNSSSSTAPSSSPAVKHHSISAISSSSPPSTIETPTTLCRGCNTVIDPYSGQYDKFLHEQIKNGTMKPRLTCFNCKHKYKLGRSQGRCSAFESVNRRCSKSQTHCGHQTCQQSCQEKH